MLIKGVKTEVNGNLLSVPFPDKKTIILRGSNGLQILHIVESLLSNDFTGYYFEADKQYGFYYKPVTGMSQLAFNDGSIYGKDKAIHTQGVIPKIHCIRYLGKSNKIRSFVISNDLQYSELYVDTTKYSTALTVAQWMRLISLINKVVGFEMVTLEDEQLSIQFREDYEIPVEGQQIIYMLIAECFVTPQGYSRVLLLPDIPYLSGKVQAELLETIDNINGHTLTLSSGSVQLSDFSPNSIVSYLIV